MSVACDDRAAVMPKSTPVRLSDEAIRWARIASGYTGESMSGYVSRIVVERGREDADRYHDELKAAGKPVPKAEPKGKPRGNRGGPGQ